MMNTPACANLMMNIGSLKARQGDSAGGLVSFNSARQIYEQMGIMHGDKGGALLLTIGTSMWNAALAKLQGASAAQDLQGALECSKSALEAGQKAHQIFES